MPLLAPALKTRSRGLALLLVSGALLPSAKAQAGTVEASAVTLVAGRQDPRDGRMQTVVPVVELVSLTASGLDAPYVKDVRVDFSAWGGTNPLDPGARDGPAADVQLASAQGRLLDRKLSLRLGRQLVVGGVARALSLDGLDATVTPLKGLAFELYGGSPVIPRFATARGDALAGGRVSYRYGAVGELGASAIAVLDHGYTARRDVGGDLRLYPLSTVTVAAHAVLSVVEARLADGEVAALWQPLPSLELSANLRRDAPDLLLPRTSIFSVFSEETRDELGGSVYFQPARRLSLFAELYALRFAGTALDPTAKEQSTGLDATGRITYKINSGSSAGLLARRLKAGPAGFSRGRAHLLQRLSQEFFVALDADAVMLDTPLNGQDRSYTGTASASYRLSGRWTAVLAGAGGVTPLFSRRLEVMAKLAFHESFTLSAGAD